MYSWKELMRAGLTFAGIMAFLAAFLTINGLHYAGVI
jgi:hypothetical protein